MGRHQNTSKDQAPPAATDKAKQESPMRAGARRVSKRIAKRLKPLFGSKAAEPAKAINPRTKQPAKGRTSFVKDSHGKDSDLDAESQSVRSTDDVLAAEEGTNVVEDTHDDTSDLRADFENVHSRNDAEPNSPLSPEQQIAVLQRQLAESLQVTKDRDQTIKQLKRGANYDDMKEFIDKICLEIVPKTLGVGGPPNLGAPKTSKKIFQRLEYDDTLDRLCQFLKQEFIPAVFGKDECFDVKATSLKETIKREQQAGPCKLEPATSRHWREHIIPHLHNLVISLGKQYERFDQLSPTAQEAFRKLEKFLCNLPIKEMWPGRADELQVADVNPEPVFAASGPFQGPRLNCDLPDTNELRSDIYSVLRRNGHPDATVVIAEVKAYHEVNAAKLANSCDRETLFPANDHQSHTSTSIYDICANMDQQVAAAFSQCYTYNLHSACPITILTLLQSNVFFRWDYTQEAEATCKIFTVSAVEKEGQFEWKDADILVATFAALLLGINDSAPEHMAEKRARAEAAWKTSPWMQEFLDERAKRKKKTAKQKKGVGRIGKGKDQDEEKDEDGNWPEDHSSTGSENSRGQPDDDKAPDNSKVRRSGSGGAGNRGSSSKNMDRLLYNGLIAAIPVSDSDFGPDRSACSTPELSNGSTSSQSSLSSSAATMFKAQTPNFIGHKLDTLVETDHISALQQISAQNSIPETQQHSSEAAVGAETGHGGPKELEEEEDEKGQRYALRSDALLTARWCTPACLLSLQRDGLMDPLCPNVRHHCPLPACPDHAKHGHSIDVGQIKRDIKMNLAKGKIVHVMEPILHGQGTDAQLFRVLHPQKGYAFAAKGVIDYLESKLEHEHKVYQRLWHQAPAGTNGFPVLNNVDSDGFGLQIPLSFGIIKPADEQGSVMYPLWPLQEAWNKTLVCNTFLLMSYHGNKVDLEEPSMTSLPATAFEGKGWLEETCRSALLKHEIRHGDLYSMRNLLWCRRLQAVVVIDFADSLVTETDDHRPNSLRWLLS